MHVCQGAQGTEDGLQGPEEGQDRKEGFKFPKLRKGEGWKGLKNRDVSPPAMACQQPHTWPFPVPWNSLLRFGQELSPEIPVDAGMFRGEMTEL